MNFTVSFFQFSTIKVDSFCAFVFQYISKHAFKLTLHAIRSCCNFIKVYIDFQDNMQSFCRILVTFWYIWYPRVLLNFSDFLLSVDIQYISIYHFFTERNSGSKEVTCFSLISYFWCLFVGTGLFNLKIYFFSLYFCVYLWQFLYSVAGNFFPEV